MANKPKTNRAGNVAVSLEMDRCQTPLYALDVLLPYLNPDWTIWEPAEGDGNIYRGLYRAGIRNIIGSDVQQGLNYFEYQPFTSWDCQVTNPPYTIKYPWLERAYALEKPFALLLPVDIKGAAKAQKLFRKYGVETIYMDKRINFKMPRIGYAGSTQFSTAWFTWGLGIGRENTYAEITRIPDEEWRVQKEIP